MSKHILEEESYFIDIYIDICNDLVAFETRYRFTTKELADEFCKKLDIIQKCSLEYDHNIGYEKTRGILGYTEEKPYRPRFNNVVEALKDLNVCINWCYKIDKDYLYKGTIFEITIKEYEQLYLTNTNIILNKKVDELKEENKNLKEEIKNLKEEKLSM